MIQRWASRKTTECVHLALYASVSTASPELLPRVGRGRGAEPRHRTLRYHRQCDEAMGM